MLTTACLRRQPLSKPWEREMASMLLVEGRGDTKWGLICGLYKILESTLSSQVRIQACLLYIFSALPRHVFMIVLGSILGSSWPNEDGKHLCVFGSRGLCAVTDIFACLPFICGLHFNLFLIAYLAHLAIKVKWLFDKCESFLISANCFC